MNSVFGILMYLWRHLYVYSYGTDTRSTLLDNVDCSSSSYLVLLQCSYSTVISSLCVSNYYDAYVSCCKLFINSITIDIIVRFN